MPYTPFISSYLAAGLDASKPTAATLAATIPAGSTAFYYATDNGKLYAVEGGGSAWVQLNGSATAIADDRIMANISGGSAVPVANTLSDIIDACIGNTQGSLLYRGASSWSALAPGTAGQVLTSGGAGANPSWAAGGGGGSSDMVLLQSQNFSAVSSVDFTNKMTDTYKTYILRGSHFRYSADWNAAYMRFSHDGGSTFDSGTNYSVQTLTWHNATTDPNGWGASGTEWYVTGGAGQTVARSTSFEYTLQDMRVATERKAIHGSSYGYGADDSFYHQMRQGSYNDVTNKQDSIRIAVASGTFSGQVSLYGIV